MTRLLLAVSAIATGAYMVTGTVLLIAAAIAACIMERMKP
jgi:hypothetical protein